MGGVKSFDVQVADPLAQIILGQQSNVNSNFAPSFGGVETLLDELKFWSMKSKFTSVTYPIPPQIRDCLLTTNHIPAFQVW